MDVGAALRDAREQRRLSVDQLSRTTKISVATLRAIEKNEIDTLPGGIFIRGFLRAYAREVGLDVEDTVQRYLAQFEPRPDEVVPIETDDTWLELTPAVHRETNVDEAGQRAASVRLLFVGLALAIGLAGYLAFHESGTPAPPSEAPAERAANEALPPSTVPGPVETATSGSYDANAPATRRQDVVLLDIRTLGPCWVSATADGLSVVYRLMQAGERQTIEARDEVVLRIGDPAAFTFFINNTPGRTLGRAGQAVTLRITAQNYREFVSP
jgi:transcriptional regulator with XRE-family HTH domain